MYCAQCESERPPEEYICKACGALLTHAPDDPDEPVETAHEPAPSGNPIVRHWKGDYSLGVSYWVFGVLLTLVIGAISSSMKSSDNVSVMTPMAAGYYIAFAYLFVLTITVWQLVGIFRSAKKHTSRGGSRGWAVIAMIMVGFGVLKVGVDMSRSGIPMLRMASRMITNADTMPAYQLRRFNQDTELELTGGMPFGTAAAVRREFEAFPGIRVVHMNSLGGRIGEALQLIRLFEQHKVTTYTSSVCVSACAIAFLGGEERYISEDAKLGFHSSSLGDIKADADELNAPVLKAMEARKIPRYFAKQSVETPPDDMWFPSHDELKRARVVHAVVDRNRFGISGVAGWQDVDRLEADLLKLPAMAAMKRFDPDNFAALRDQIRQGIEEGLPLLEVTHRTRIYFSNVMVPAYIKTAPDGPLIRYWQVQLDEMNFLFKRDPQLCFNFLMPQMATAPVDIERIMPTAIKQADLAALAELIEGAATAPVSFEYTPQVQSDLDAVFERLAMSDPQSLDVIQRMGSGEVASPAPYCRAIINLYSEVLKTPDPARRGALLRYMMES